MTGSGKLCGDWAMHRCQNTHSRWCTEAPAHMSTVLYISEPNATHTRTHTYVVRLQQLRRRRRQDSCRCYPIVNMCPTCRRAPCRSAHLRGRAVRRSALGPPPSCASGDEQRLKVTVIGVFFFLSSTLRLEKGGRWESESAAWKRSGTGVICPLLSLKGCVQVMCVSCVRPCNTGSVIVRLIPPPRPQREIRNNCRSACDAAPRTKEAPTLPGLRYSHSG